MEFYLNLADDKLKQDNDDKSIGIILCKTKDGVVVEYALRDSIKPIGIAEYQLSNILPDNIKGEFPSIEEIEAEIEKEYQELKSPAEKRFDVIKDKISKFQVGEIKLQGNLDILTQLFETSMLPLYKAIIKKFESFQELFVSSGFGWTVMQKNINTIEELAGAIKQENFFLNVYNFQFWYRLDGFKKAGTEAFSIYVTMTTSFDPYWYGFSFINYNNQQPILKKLYHDQLTAGDISMLTCLAFELAVNDIDRRIDILLQGKPDFK